MNSSENFVNYKDIELEENKQDYEELLFENIILSAELDYYKKLCCEIKEDTKKEEYALRNSFSWKITQPIRSFAGIFMRKSSSTVGYYEVFNSVNLARKYGKTSFPKKNVIQQQKAISNKMVRQPLFSILVPLFNTPLVYLNEMIDSVVKQTYSNWELCLIDASDKEHDYIEKKIKKYREKDNRIKYQKLIHNEGISKNTNVCIEMSTGNYLCLLDHDDILHPSALYYYALEINKSNADLLYCNEITFFGKNLDNIQTFHCKPDYAPDTLRSNNYICHFCVFSRKLIQDSDWFRSEYDGSQDYDLILRLTQKAEKVAHIDKVLYYWRNHENSTAGRVGSKDYAIEAGKRAIEDYLKSIGEEDAEVSTLFVRETIYKVRYRIRKQYHVEIVICDNGCGEECATYLVENTTYNNYNVKIAKLEYISQLISEMQDDAVVVIMDDAVRNKNKYWILQLLMYSQRQDAGVVGGKLLDESDLVYSAGIAVSKMSQSGFIHLFKGEKATNIGYMARLIYTQNVTAISGRCCMFKKTLWDEFGGWNVYSNVDASIIELCMKALSKGYLNVYVPYVEFVIKKHYKMNNTISKVVNENLRDLVEKGDRYFSMELNDSKIFTYDGEQDV